MTVVTVMAGERGTAVVFRRPAIFGSARIFDATFLLLHRLYLHA